VILKCKNTSIYIYFSNPNFDLPLTDFHDFLLHDFVYLPFFSNFVVLILNISSGWPFKRIFRGCLISTNSEAVFMTSHNNDSWSIVNFTKNTYLFLPKKYVLLFVVIIYILDKNAVFMQLYYPELDYIIDCNFQNLHFGAKNSQKIVIINWNEWKICQC